MKRLSSGEKLLIGACGAALLVLGGLGALYRKTTASLGAVPAPLALPKPNGFDRYVAAALAIVPARPAVDAVNDTRVLSPQQAASAYTPARRRAWIAANTKAWTLFDGAKTLPCRHPNRRGILTPFAAERSLRELARCQSIRVKECKSQGQWNAAMNGGLDTLQMGRNIERGAPLIGSLVGIAIEHIGEHAVEDVPSHLSAKEAKAATRRLEILIGKAQPFSEVLSEEKWNFLAMIDSTMGTSRGASGVVVTVLTARGRSSYVSMMDDFTTQADKPVKSQKPAAPPSSQLSVLDIYSGLYPSTQKSLFNDARRQTLEQLLLLRLALRAYRAQNGRYPAQLSQLTPMTLQRVPVDPFGAGEALRYRQSGDSYLAWSIGPDGADNGGTPIPLKAGKKRVVVVQNSRGDVVARP
jgi:type II secretory pathway pseudopilin PulG